MIDFINNMNAKQEDDIEVCDMEIDKIVDESLTEISENDISQESQVLYLKMHKKLLYFALFVGVLLHGAKCVLDAARNTRCVHIKICYSEIIEPFRDSYTLLFFLSILNF